MTPRRPSLTANLTVRKRAVRNYDDDSTTPTYDQLVAENERLRRLLRRRSQTVMDQLIIRRHQEHYRSCGCLGDSDVCCEHLCPCHIQRDIKEVQNVG